ncbi:MAG: LacI family DNA-binding transcriptional regulator [Christensenellales bacterium]
MQIKKNYTIHDVAKFSGTSATTVSRVLSNNGYPVSDKLRQRVLDVVEKLDYSPNAMARGLKSSTSSEIGVIVPTVSNPFYSTALLGIQKQIHKRGYNILLCNTFRHAEDERNYLQILYNKRVNGVIISAVAKDGKNILEFSRKGMNFVLLDQRIEDKNCTNILFDSREGARIATEYLVNQGHTKIALITTPLTRWTRRETSKGYLDALSERADTPGEPIIFEADSEQEENQFGYEYTIGTQLAKRFIQLKCDATGALCVNDMVAFGFIQELNKGGLKVPRDVSVIGFDDIPFASMFSPALTTVKCFAFEMGDLAGRILIDKINGSTPLDASLKIEPRLIVRDTVRQITN